MPWLFGRRTSVRPMDVSCLNATQALRSLRYIDRTTRPLNRSQSFEQPVPYQKCRRQFFQKCGDSVISHPAFGVAFVCLFLSAAPHNSNAQGLSAGGVHQVFGVDTVDVKTGHSYIQIPLVSIPQRGQLKTLDFILSANTSTWSSSTQCSTPQGFAPITCTHSYLTTGFFGPSISTPSLFGFTATAVDLGTSLGVSTQSIIYSAVDGTGASHRLWFDSSNPLQLRTIDGSGYLAQFQSGSQPYNPFSAAEGLPTPIATIFDSNGRKLTIAAPSLLSTITDVDNNSIAGTADGGWTDTVGRHIPFPVNGTDLGQCVTPPAGGFSPTGISSWTVPGYSQPFILCYTTIHVHTNFWGNEGKNVTDPNCDPTNGCTHIDEWDETVQDQVVLQSLKLPDGTSWKFAYDSAPANDPNTIAYGNLTRIVGPTGGSISYCYALEPVAALSELITTGHDGRVTALVPYITNRVETQSDSPIDCNQALSVPNWTYSINVNAVSVPGYQVQVNDPNGNDIIHVFPFQGTIGGRLDNPQVPDESDQFYFVGSFAANNVIKHIVFHYDHQPLVGLPHDNSGDAVLPTAHPSGEDTTIDGVAVSSTSRTYPSTFTPRTYSCQFAFGNPSLNNCFSADASAPVSMGIATSSSIGGQQTATQYKWQDADHSFLNANIMAAVSSVTVSDATSSSTTRYGYDDSDYVTSGLGPGHLTSVTRVNDNGPDVTTYTHYGTYGMIDYSKDARGTIPSSISSWDSQHLFPAQVTTPIGTESFTYDPDTGHLLSQTDLNGGVTMNNYDDMGRLQSTQNPDTVGGFTTYWCYPDPNTRVQYQAQSLALAIPASCGAELGDAIVSKAILDGLGRVTDVIKGTGGIATAQSTQYDLLDRPNQQSNPHMASDGAGFWTTSHYDALGRIYQIDHPDGSTSYNIPTGLTIISTDESGLKKTIVNDALGRIVQVLEPSALTGNLTLSTTYGYNVRGLTDVWQNGESGETVRHRHFTYDSLNRLINSQNPETGTVTYQYTTSGSLCAGEVSSPCSKTDARGVTTSYAYDSLNRLTGKTYSGQSAAASMTPSSCYQYDMPLDANQHGNSIGRLVGEWTQPNACPGVASSIPSSSISWRYITQYDSMGRITSEQQCAWAPCNSPRPLSYGYDLAGNLTSSTNGIPLGTTIDPTAPGISLTYGIDSAGRLKQITSNWSGANSATLFEADQSINGTPPYGPFGLTAAQIGVTSSNQQVIALLKGYDNRGRINSIAATAQTGSSLPPGTLTITTALNNVVSGTSPTVSVQDVCNAACGSVHFSVSGPSTDGGTTTLGANGSGSFQISSSLVQGNYTLTVSFSGNAQYSASSTSVNFSVVASGLPPTSLSATLSATPVVQGTSPTLTTVLGCNSACGIVTYLLDGQPLQTSNVNADGTVAPISLNSSLAIGQHTIAISYGGSTVQAPAATSVTFTVVSNILTLTVNLDVNPVPAGETPRILTSANCNACGTINYALDGAVFQQSSIGSNGSAIATLSPQLSTGSHLLTVSYQGNGAYQPSSTSLTFQVIPNTLPVPTLVASPQMNPAAVGTSPTVIAVLGCSNACGYVTYSMDGQVFQTYPVNSDGTVPSPPISPNVAVGVHTITVSYGGNAQFAPASTSVTFNVVSAVSMTISGSLNVNPVPAGETPLMLSQVGCTIPCGYMNYAVDGTVIQGSTILPDGSSGNVLSPSPSVGWHILTVTNLGDATHAAVSTSFAFQVIPDTLPVLSLVASLPTNPVLYGTSPGVITILGSNISSAGGSVSWYVDGTIFQQWQSPAGTFTGPPTGPQIPANLPVGAHSLTVQYGGDANYAPSTTTIPFAVVSAVSMTVTASLDVNPVPIDETPIMRSQVSCNASCGYMNFAVDGTIIQGSSILSDGSGGNILNPVPSVGWHILTTTNLGDATHGAASSSFPFQVIPDTLPVLSLEVSLPTNPVPYGATPGITCILGSNTSSASGFMSFTMDGVLFQKWQVINGATGGPPIPSDLPVGAHTLTVHYGGDANYAPATAIYPFTVVPNQ
jgi:YD repeat-containing protein